MEDKTFYDRIIEDKLYFDKVMYDIEHFINNAPSLKAKHLGQEVRNGLIAIQSIAEHCKNR